jgi:hypothetical protein
MRKLNLRFGESGEELYARLLDLSAQEDMSLNSLILDLLRSAVDVRAHGMIVLLTGAEPRRHAVVDQVHRRIGSSVVIDDAMIRIAGQLSRLGNIVLVDTEFAWPQADITFRVDPQAPVTETVEQVCQLIGYAAAANLQTTGVLYPDDPRGDGDA